MRKHRRTRRTGEFERGAERSRRGAGSPAGGAEVFANGADFDAELEIERILPGGVGLAHAAGKTVLVALAAPGDRVRVRFQKARGAVVFASIVEVVSPSPARVEPPCPYFGRCGGCDFQQLSYEAQLASKAEIICDCLRRIARVEPPAHIPVTPSPRAWHYRSRAQWQYDPHRGSFGYFERESHKVQDIAECPVVVPELDELLKELRAEADLCSLPAGAHDFQAVAGDGGAVSLAPALRERHARELTRTVAGEHYRFDATCFFQINHDLLDPLVREALQDASGETAVDLYCGVGLFTLPLARRFARVLGVEGHATAARYARRNLSDAGLTNARVETSAVGEWLTAHAAQLAPVDFLLLDPPRTGAEPSALEGILTLHPRHISYVSCDPATLARDLRPLLSNGYGLASISAFDMFPQTHHVETLARLALQH